MILRSDELPRSADVAKHGGAGEFGVETILTKEQMGKAGRLFVRGTLKPGHSVACTGMRGIRKSAISSRAREMVREEDGKTYTVYPGDVNVTPSGHAHEIVNTQSDANLVYLAVVLFNGDR